jgi:XFP C-terminal domain
MEPACRNVSALPWTVYFWPVPGSRTLSRMTTDGSPPGQGNPADPATALADRLFHDVIGALVLDAVSQLREHLPALKVQVVNVVDLIRLKTPSEHPHGMSDAEFDALFTTDKPVIFAYHGYPWLIYRRHGMTTCMCAAIRRRARPPPRSTWSC